MEKQEREFDAFKTQYNTMKGEYDTLIAKEDAGTALTPTEAARVEELIGEYMKNQELFEGFENDRKQKERDNTEKEFNKE